MTEKFVFPEVEIGQILEKVTNPVKVELDKKYVQIGIRSHGKGLFDKEEVTGKELGNKRVFWVEPDCFVVNIVFAWEQAVGRTTKEDKGKIASHRFPMYRPKNGKADIDFISYLFKTKYGKELLTLASPGGAGRNKTLGQSEFVKLKIRVPSGVEQKKIAEILKTWDEAIDTVEKLIANAELQLIDLSNLLITGKQRLTGHAKPWKKTCLEEIGLTYSGMSGMSKLDFTGDNCNGHYVPYKNVFDNKVINPNYLERVRTDNSAKHNVIKFGDILFTTSSETPQEVGMSSVALFRDTPVFLNSFCFGFRPNSLEELHPQFAAHLFRSSFMRTKISSLAQGSTRFNISKSKLSKLSFELPSIEEQKAISIMLDAASENVDKLKITAKHLEKEKSALMQQLLTGKRRVKIDKEDMAA